MESSITEEKYSSLIKLITKKFKADLTTQNNQYKNEPLRNRLLTVLMQKPFNAETPKELSVETFFTPNDLFFVRNHLPVPKIDLQNFNLEIIDAATGQKYSFKLDELKNKFKSYTIPVTIQCSGNKRKFMNELEQVQGLMWDVNAISNAEWTGIKLKDLLDYCKIDLNDARIKHVQFEGLDKDPAGSPYGASIPKEKVLNEFGDTLIAYKMNGVDIPLDHGFPLRAVVPGVIGARSVKWLSKIIVSSEESKNYFYLNYYRRLPPSIKKPDHIDFSNFRALQESCVQSAICEPCDGAVLSRSVEKIKIKGYAYSGAGNFIEKVLVTLNKGLTWNNAVTHQLDSPLYRQWSWTIWELEQEIPEKVDFFEVTCTACDSSLNTQPENVGSIWNLSGESNNAWHTIKIYLK